MKKNEILSHAFTHFLSPEYQDSFHFAFYKVKNSNKKQSLEVQLILETKELVWVKIEMISYDNGENTFISVHNKEEEKMAEIELKRQREQLQDLNSTKDKLFSIIGHDLKSPMSHIISFSNLLHSKYNTYTDSKRKQFIDIILESANSVHILLDNLLEWAHSQTKTKKIIIENTDLKEVIETVIELFKHSFSEKQIEIKNYIQESVFIRSDIEMLKTILRNLLSNALKFSYPKSQIEIAIENTSYNSIIRISDSGKGMSPETVKNLFKSGKVSSEEGTNGEKGTGLGLIICKEFVEQLSGKIWVESTEKQGSSFFFTLPLVHSLKVEKIGSAKYKVLIIDDEELNYFLLFEYLANENVETVYAENGQAAIALCKKSHFDLIIMDIVMPDMNGYQVCREIRKFNKKVPVIAISGNPAYINENFAIEAGCDAIYEKPIDEKRILSIANQYLQYKIGLTF